MAEEPINIASFLRGTIPFEKWGESELGKLAAEGRELPFQKGDYLYGIGKSASDFYFVAEGKVRLNVRKGKALRQLGLLLPGDSFGEDLLLGKKRITSASGFEAGRVVVFPRKSLMKYLKNHKETEQLLHCTAKSRQLASARAMKWLAGDEVIYVITRKHPFKLFMQLIVPVLLIIVAFLLIVAGLLEGSFLGLGIGLGALLGIGGLAWLLWRIVDWSNDYYVVTNRRVMWVEKTIALYDSRQEAPLEQVQSADQISNPVLRRFIDYAKVIIKTYTGSITMEWAWHPDDIIAYANALQNRSKKFAQQISMEAMEAVIARRLGYAPPEPPKPATAKPAAAKKRKSRFSNPLKMRFQDGDTITYRKHLYILIKMIWFQLFLALLFGGLGIYLVRTGSLVQTLISCIWIFLMLAIVLWLIYNYANWANDIYVLTLDKILDIKRTPLTREEKKEAPLDRILSTETQKIGLIPLVLNVGDVVINIGTERFVFEGVYNPNSVQYEINDRREAAKKRKEDADAARERERVADWLVAYHNQITKLEKLENDQQGGENSG
jgi:hypothetical protein